eukprot:7540782-Lingulodinium_polyedra.AAC.1
MVLAAGSRDRVACTVTPASSGASALRPMHSIRQKSAACARSDALVMKTVALVLFDTCTDP